MFSQSTINKIICTGVALAFSTGVSVADEPPASEPQLNIRAKPVVRTPPDYPHRELVRGQQGWVELSYVVTEDGRVIDPVVEDSSGSRLFEKAALRTVEAWKYEPATVNGKPVQQCQTKVLISFAIEDNELQVSRGFYSDYRKIDKALLKGDAGKAQELLDEMSEAGGMTNAELAWYWSLRARHEGLAGDKPAQLEALRKATVSDGRWITEELYPGILLLRAVRELETGDYVEAIGSYEKLLETGSDLPEIEALGEMIQKVRRFADSDQMLAVPASIESENWRHRPLRRKFTLTQIQGTLDDLEIRCSWKRFVDKAREGVSWKIPESWGDCSIFVFGEPGSSFTLVEEPVASSAEQNSPT